MANIGFISLGCAKNQVDCERMMYRVQDAGFTVQAEVVGADVVVINTCGFIDSAKTEAIEHILQVAQLKADGLVGKILVTGCLSQRYQEQILEELPEVDGVLGTGSYTQVVPAIQKLLENQAVEEFGSIDAPEEETGRILTTPEHYAYIKIAEGCDNRCSYCIIPYLRGKFRSRNMDDVLYEARLLAASGVKELLVVAQDTSRYGTDFPEHKRLLAELLQNLCKIDGIKWIRIHYLYPDEIDDELIRVIAEEPKIVKYLDLPIQHCNTKILKLMNRKGTRESYLALFQKLRENIPDIAIRSTFISGFPTETEAEFEGMKAFLKEAKLINCGFFAYSREPDTGAYRMKPQVHHATKQRRVRALYAEQEKISAGLLAEFVGKEIDVLCDGIDYERGCFIGRAYFNAPDIDGKVYFHAVEAVQGETYVVTVEKADAYDLFGCTEDYKEK